MPAQSCWNRPTTIFSPPSPPNLPRNPPASVAATTAADHPPLDDRHFYGHPRSPKGINSGAYHRNQSPDSVFGLVTSGSIPDNSANAIFATANRTGGVEPVGAAYQSNGTGCNGYASSDFTAAGSAFNGAPLPPEIRNTTTATMNNILSPNGHVVHSPTNHNSSSANKISPVRADFYWFAQGGDSPHVDNYVKVTANHGSNVETDVASGAGMTSEALQLDRDERIRVLRERQAEDRQRRLDELRSAAVSAQKFREIQEEERRRKIEEIRWRDTERRHLVEERKRQIWEAERERRETILRKSQERETRIEAKRNAQRNSIGFAFGSCTPRMLDLEMTSSATAASASTMAGRRSNSQSNVLGGTTALSRGESVDTQDGEPSHGSSALDHRRSNSVNHRHTIHEALFWETYTSDSHPPAPKVQPSVSVNAPWAITELPKPPLNTKPNTSFAPGCRQPQGNLYGAAVLVGGDDLMTQSLTSLASTTPFRRGRRRTDLVPTIPSTSTHRDSPSTMTSSRTRSPGRAYSMTRLDQLATPRKMRPLEALREGFKQEGGGGGGGGKKKITPAKSMIQLAYRSKVASGGGGGRPLNSAAADSDQRSLSKSKSTSHLGPRDRSTNRPTTATATTGGGSPPNLMSQSMWHLSPQPRPTRTSILRRESGNLAQRQGGTVNRISAHPRRPPKSGGSGSGDSETDTSSIRAPSSPSRPQSSMSQQSLSSQNSSTVSLRARNSTQSASRRPRPLSVAGSQPDRPSVDERRGRSVEKRMPLANSTVNSKPPPRAKSVGASQLIDGQPAAALKVTPVPAKRRPPPPPPPPKKQTTPTQEKPKIPPKPNLRKPADIIKAQVLVPTESDTVITPTVKPNAEEQAPPVPQEPLSIGSESPSEADDVPTHVTSAQNSQVVPEPRPVIDEATLAIDADVTGDDSHDEKPAGRSSEQDEIVAEIAQVEIKDALQQIVLEDDPTMMGGPVAKPRITTEEEAKAALAEKRRLAREQAEREAELERQRQEQLRRDEEERLRREEEEQREWELEQGRSRQAEQERLRRAIEEQEQREEEERLRREDEAKQKDEKEKADRIAREEQEKARKENEEKLRREEEERAQRRRRVEAIMSRTRGGKTGGTSTPPLSSKNNMDPTSALFAQDQEQDQEQQMMDVAAGADTDGDGDDDVHQPLTTAHQNGISSQETSPTEDVDVGNVGRGGEVRTNGFSVNAQVDIQLVDGRGNPSKKPMATNDDNGSGNVIQQHADPQLVQDHQLIDLTVMGMENPTMVVVSAAATNTKAGGLGEDVVHRHHLSNEDSVNFNVTRNGIDDSSFVIDNYANNARQETMTDLLS